MTKTLLDKAGRITLPKTYDALMGLHPVRPIHHDRALKQAVAVLDRMAGHALNPDQEDYLDALSTLVEEYERTRHRIEPKISGRTALRALLAEHGMIAADLARLLGVHRSLGSKLLTGERALTISHLKILSEHFKVSADLFLD